MLEILSLVACEWILMYNPTNNLNRPITEWQHAMSFDNAQDCESQLNHNFEWAKKEKREFSGLRLRCIPADAIYPHTQPKK